MFLFNKKSQQGGGQARQQAASAAAGSNEGQRTATLQGAERQNEKQNKDELKKKEDSVKNFIGLLKKQHGEGMISDKIFNETLAKNEEELKRIKGGSAPLQNETAKSDPESAAAEKNAAESRGGDPAGAAAKGGKKAGKKKNENNAAPPKKEKKKKADSAKSGPHDSGDETSGIEKSPEAAPQGGAEKTVGEILKDEGVIHDERKAGKVRIEQEVDMNKMLMDIEKLTAEFEALRDIKFQSDERIKEIAESIGEMRSLIFQRDGAIKELQMKVEKMDDSISDIRPEKIAGEMGKREQESLETGAKIEKIERMNEDIARQMKGTQKILENVKSMENLVSVSREIGEKLSKIEELKSGTERDAEKAEKMYLEMERRTGDLIQAKESIRRLDELTRELLKSMDEEKIKMGGFATKEDLQKSLESALKPPVAGKTQEDKIGERHEIESLLKNIELQYKKGIISKESFGEVNEKNKAVLQMLDSEIKEGEAKKQPQTVFDWLQEMEGELKNLRVKISFIENSLAPKPADSGPQKRGVLPPAEAENPSISMEDEERSEGGSHLHKPAGNMEAEDIKELMAEIEDQYREGMISESTYSEMIEKNRKRLAEIESGPESSGEAACAGSEKSRKINSLLADLGK